MAVCKETDTRPTIGAESITHAILDAQGDEVKAFEGGLHGSSVDANALAHIKPFVPGDVLRHAIDVIFLLISNLGQLDQKSRRKT